MALIHHDGIPVDPFEVMSVAACVLESVDADDRSLVVRERVAVDRDLAPNLGNAVAVEADQRDGEAGPQLVLKLFEYVAWGDDENAVASSSAYQLAQDHADFKCLAEAYCVGNEQTRLQSRECLVRCLLLILEFCEELLVSNGEARLGCGYGALTEDRFEVEATTAKAGAVIEFESGVLGPHRDDGIDFCEEAGLRVSNEDGTANAVDPHPV